MSDQPFLGPRWAKYAMGWVLLVLGGVVALAWAGIFVLFAWFHYWAAAIGIAPVGAMGAMAAVAGRRMLRAPVLRVKGHPRGAAWISIGFLLMLPLLWGWGRVFVGSGTVRANARTGAVSAAGLLLFLLSFPVLRRYEARRGSRIQPGEWAAVEGTLAGVEGVAEVMVMGRPIWIGLLGGLVLGLLFALAFGVVFLWWGRVGRDWARQRNVPLRWPLT